MSNPNYTVVAKPGVTPWHAQELVLTSAEAEKPESPPVGTVAYTADLSYMAMYDGTEWKEIGGED